MAFDYVLTGLDGVPVSELPSASSKSTALPVLGTGVSSLTVRGGTADADALLEGDALLRVYERDELTDTVTLLAHHRLITAEEVGTDVGTTVAATFADPSWTLGRRLVGKSNAGYSRGTAVSLVDRGTIIGELLAATNAESPSGLRAGVVEESSSTYVAGWFYKPLLEAIADLCAVFDGPDWRVRPIEYEAGYYGELDVVPSLATLRPDAVFEYGEGLLNVRGFRRAVTLESALNRVYSLPSGFPDNAVGLTLQRDAAASQAARGLLEGLVASDLPVDAFRAALLEHHLAVRQTARQTITFEPVRDLGYRVPRLGRDFNVGDVLPFRASIRTDAGALLKRIDVLVRVYAWQVTVDEAGYGTPTLTVTPT